VDRFSIPLSSLRLGSNTVALLQRSISGAFNYVMYDYINLELPASVSLPPGRALVWHGGNGGNDWDLNTTANWLTTNGTTVTFTNGDNVTFDDSGVPNLSITENALLQPGSVTVISSNNYVFNGTAGIGALNGPMALIKSGSGTLTVNNTNGFTGGVLLSGGRVNMGTSGALGLGTLQLGGGTIQLNNGGTLLNAVNVVAPSAIATTGNSYINGAISGSSMLTVATANVLTFQGSVANFTGTVTMGSSGGYLRFNQTGTSGVPNGSADAGTGTATIENRLTGAGTIYLGALSGGPGSKLRGTDQTSNPGAVDTFVIGSLNLDTTFAGTIGDTAHLVAIRKIGTGTLILSGTSSYSGLTAIGAGTLAISGSLSTTNSLVVSSAATLDLSGTLTVNTVQINAGGTLTNCGTLNGNLLNNGMVICACGPGQNLVISGNVTNNGMMQFLAGTGLQVSGVFVNNGVLDLITGSQTLPANFINHGTVLDASDVRLQPAAFLGPDVNIRIQSYPGHGYQLQRSAILNPAVWQDIGPAQDGTGSVLAFIEPNAAVRATGFYRILVYP
jgi:autotransporter-associated beta strand protein